MNTIGKDLFNLKSQTHNKIQEIIAAIKAEREAAKTPRNNELNKTIIIKSLKAFDLVFKIHHNITTSAQPKKADNCIGCEKIAAKFKGSHPPL